MALGGDDGENAIDSEPFTIEHSTEVLREMVPASPSPFPAPASSAGGSTLGQLKSASSARRTLMQSTMTPLSGCAPSTTLSAMPHRPPLHAGCWMPSSTSPLQTSRLRSVRRSKKSHGAKL